MIVLVWFIYLFFTSEAWEQGKGNEKKANEYLGPGVLWSTEMQGSWAVCLDPESVIICLWGHKEPPEPCSVKQRNTESSQSNQGLSHWRLCQATDWREYWGDSCGAQLLSASQPSPSHQHSSGCSTPSGKAGAPAQGGLQLSWEPTSYSPCRLWSMVGIQSMLSVILITRNEGFFGHLTWSLRPFLTQSYITSHYHSGWCKILASFHSACAAVSVCG